MKSTLAIAALAGALAIGGLSGCASESARMAEQGKHRVVIQMSDNDPQKWNLALNNAQNLQQALGKENVQVEIVAYGPGLNMLKANSKVAGRVNGALDQNVDIVACGNTMKKMKVGKDDLIAGTRVVEGGVIEISERQSQGWTYIKP
ncbi:MAG TPA: DsrE family protein [Burkholderiales bacterium]|nr:DsrE family protein [Burkholderiales bacterium]